MHPPSLGIRVSDIMLPLAPSWRALEFSGVCHPYQSFDWLSRFNATVPQPGLIQYCFVSLHNGDETVAILPLLLRRKSGLKLLAWCGDAHSNYRGGVYARALLDNLSPETFAPLWQRIKAALPRFDATWLQAQMQQQDGYVSPFQWISATASANTAHQLIFPHHDWPALAATLRGKKVRKRMRNEENRLHREGEIRWKTLNDAAEIERYLPLLFSQRSTRMVELGIAVEEHLPQYQAFYLDLLLASQAHGDNQFSLIILKLDELLLSAIVIFRWKNAYYPLINSMTSSDYRRWSPGEYVLRIMMQQACDESIEMIDYGPGDDPYKTAWCNHDIPMYDTIQGETALGKTSVALIKAATGSKRLIKNSPLLWGWYRQLRKWRGTSRTTEQTEK